MKRIRLIISGHVQGVGYRVWAKRQAIMLSLVGWVKNRPDDAVEAIAEGGETALLKFVEQCRVGPEVSDVSGVEVAWESATGEFDRFMVLY